MPRVQHTPLTDQKIRHLKPGPRPVDVRDGLQRGLIVTVLPSGRKQFAVRYRTHGKQRRLVLGDFPALSLSKAREQAQDARNETRKGRDLVVERAGGKSAVPRHGALEFSRVTFHILFGQRGDGVAVRRSCRRTFHHQIAAFPRFVAGVLRLLTGLRERQGGEVAEH